jgi:glycosyltransferase involved in cell wall biosynthesis
MCWAQGIASSPSHRNEEPELSQRPLVSVVTPSLNQAPYILQTVRSVRDQSYEDIEHIVVDGGSTDGTVEILAGLEGSSLFRWTSEPDRGMYDAINKGLESATGDILAYLNSDDLYVPWAVERIVDFFANHPEADLVYGDYIRLDVEGREMLLLQPPYNAPYIRRSGYIPQPTTFWRREVWEAIGPFDSTLFFVGDCDYWIRVGRRFGIVKLDEVLAYDRIQSGAKRSTNDEGVRTELDRVRKRYRPAGGERVPLVVTAIWVAVQRRLQLARFALAAGRQRNPSGPWSGIIGGRSVRIRPWLLALAFLPGMSVRFLPRAIRFDPPTTGSGAASIRDSGTA